jgi:hypothetical protein
MVVSDFYVKMSTLRGDGFLVSNNCPVLTFLDFTRMLSVIIPRNDTENGKNITVLLFDDNKVYFDYTSTWVWRMEINQNPFWCLPVIKNQMGLLVPQSEMDDVLFSKVQQQCLEQHFGLDESYLDSVYAKFIDNKKVRFCYTTIFCSCFTFPRYLQHSKTQSCFQ